MPRISKSIEAKAIAAAQLISLWQTFSSAWPEAVRRILPTTTKSLGHPEQIWAPILAWIILRSVPTRSDKAELFDRLHLRSALSEIFSSVGMEGENTWQAAAKVRVLLAHEGEIPTTLTHTDTFWADPDVRWLAGVNESSGTTYFNKERFEEVLCWLQLPALIKIAQQDHGKLESISQLEITLGEAVRSAKNAGYKLSEYLDRPSTKEGANQKLDSPEAPIAADTDEANLSPDTPQAVTISSQKS
jgi:hypothetical protein